MKPFVLLRGDQFRLDPPPALTSSRYARDYKEVKAVGGRDSTERPHDRANVVRLYTAVGDAILWNPIARQLAIARRASLSHAIVVATPAIPEVVLTYTKLRDITSDIDDARVYGGIHFRFDQEGGAEQGRQVGAWVSRHSLRPKRGCACDEEDTGAM